MSDHNPPTGPIEPEPIDLDATWGQPPSGADPRSATGRPIPVIDAPPVIDPPMDPGPASYETGYPRSSLAMPALILSIAGLLCCGVTAPFGLAIGALDMRAIDRGLTDPSKRGTARAAVILGAVACVLLAVVVGLSVGLSVTSTMRNP